MASSEIYAVKCRKCSESRSSNEFEPVRDFAFKHQKHTGHTTHWTETTIDSTLAQKLDLVYRLECDECNKQWQFEGQSEAEAFHEEHKHVTDHDPEPIEYVEQALEVDSPEDLVTLIDRLNTRTQGEDGAPHYIIAKASRHRGANTKDINNWLERLSQQGRIYEPTPNYYRKM